MPDPQALEMWTIYDHPHFYREGYIAVCYLITRAGPEVTGKVATSTSLDSLRDTLERIGLSGPLARSPEDVPEIVETWL